MVSMYTHSMYTFNTLYVCYRYIEEVHEEVSMMKKYFLMNLQHFKLANFLDHFIHKILVCTLCEINSFFSFKCISSILCDFVTEILKMCIK